MITITQTLTTPAGLAVPANSKAKVVEFYANRQADDPNENTVAVGVRLYKDAAAVGTLEFIKKVTEFQMVMKRSITDPAIVAIVQDPDTTLDHAERIFSLYLTDQGVTHTI